MDTEDAGRGRRRITAEVAVRDDQGQPVQGAAVTVNVAFFPYPEDVTGTTNGEGVAARSRPKARGERAAPAAPSAV